MPINHLMFSGSWNGFGFGSFKLREHLFFYESIYEYVSNSYLRMPALKWKVDSIQFAMTKCPKHENGL